MCALPTWRTFIKDKRQSWSAPWWPLWKTSGCSSSRMASTLLKKVMWFCCRNSCMFKWMRPCKRPAIIGRCLGRGKNSQQVEPTPSGTENQVFADKIQKYYPFFFFFYLSKRTGCDTASFLHARLASDTRLSADLESPTSASSVTRRCTRTSSWEKNIKISSYCTVKYHGEFIVLSVQKRNTILLNPNKSWGELYELTYFVISNGTPQCIC